MTVTVATVLFFLAWVLFVVGVVMAYALDRSGGKNNNPVAKGGSWVDIFLPFSAVFDKKNPARMNMARRAIYTFMASGACFALSYLVVIISS